MSWLHREEFGHAVGTQGYNTVLSGRSIRFWRKDRLRQSWQECLNSFPFNGLNLAANERVVNGFLNAFNAFINFH